MNADRTPWWRGSSGEWWVVAQTVLLIAVGVVPPAGPQLVPRTPTTTFAALIAGACGLLILAAGVRALGRSLTVLPRPREDAEFVQSGVYRWVRHPIYAGVILIVGSWASYRGSLLHGVLAVVIAVFFAVKARREERWLLQRFPVYDAYRRRTKRFAPWIY